MQVSYIDNSKVQNTVTKIPTKLNELIKTFVDKSKEILNAPNSETISKIDWSNITSIIQTISIILIITLIILFVLYILRAIALYKMAKKENKEFAWISFIPLGHLVSYGIILDKTKIFNIQIDHSYLLLPLLMLSTMLPYVGTLSTVLFIIARYAMLYRIYEKKGKNFAAILLILTILLPFSSPIILFILRNK